MPDTKERLQEMAKLALLANRISEFHEKNLKMYPFVFFEGIKSVTIDYDLSRTKTETDAPAVNANMMAFHLKLNESQNTEHLDKRFAAIEAAVRGLLWSDITVEVYFNDRIVFKSKKNG